MRFLALIFSSLLVLSPTAPVADEPPQEKPVGFAIAGRIDNDKFEYVRKSINTLEELNLKVALVEIDSPGGDVFSALKIIKAMKRSPVSFFCAVSTIAASAAAVILEAGCTARAMEPGSLIMFHNGFVKDFEGGIRDLEAEIGILKAINESMGIMVAARLGMTLEEYEALIDGKDLWLTSISAPKMNAVDLVVSDIRVLVPVIEAANKADAP
jgi:ATP-dependent protease ClpP protease subunit